MSFASECWFHQVTSKFKYTYHKQVYCIPYRDYANIRISFKILIDEILVARNIRLYFFIDCLGCHGCSVNVIQMGQENKHTQAASKEIWHTKLQ